MKRKTLFIFFLLLSLYGNSQQGKLSLLSAYQTKSNVKADKFFAKWETETQVLMQKNNIKANDTLTNLKSAFQCVYDSITSSTESVRNAAIYFILQNGIEYEFTDTADKSYFLENTFLFTADGQIDYLPNNKIYKLKNFVPTIKTSAKHYLLLEQKYDSLFAPFLGNKKYFSYYKGQEVGATPLSIIIKSQKETTKRLDFLSKYIQLPDNEDFTNEWNLCSYPHIPRIIFTNGFNKAWVDINFGGAGGLAYLEKVSNNWVLREIKRTWIE
ncbi:MAG: hypothetical protein WKI04_06345 [Ferruginibacter sp.]